MGVSKIFAGQHHRRQPFRCMAQVPTMGTLIMLTIATHLTNVKSLSTLADCQHAAAAFHSTCEGTVAPAMVRDIPPVQTFSLNAPNSLLTGANRIGSFTCPITFNPLDSTLVGDSCSYKRRLCVTCSISNATGRTRIRVQTNGLPDHSYWMESTNPREQNIDFEVDFDTPLVNASMNFSNPRLDFATTNELNQALCTGTSTHDIEVPSEYHFVHMGDASLASTNSFSGIAISGLAFGQALQTNSQSEFLQDSHSPTVGLAVQKDTCLLHASQNYKQTEGAQALFYTTASPCLFGAQAKQSFQRECSESNSCGSVAAEITQSYSSVPSSNKTIIGIAKDGHLVYGPTLTKDGGFDACNGIIFDGGKEDGVLRSYGYVATTTFPYLVGCFGPASYPTIKPTCTRNPAPLYLPWKDLYTVTPNATVAAPSPVQALPSMVTMVVDSSGESPPGQACSDLKAMIYKTGVSTITTQVHAPFEDHLIFFPDEFEVIPTVVSLKLEIHPLGTAAANNISASYFTVGVASVTQTILTVRVTPIVGYVADRKMFQIQYKVVASRLGNCPIRGAMEHMRRGAMKDHQHLNIAIDVPYVNIKSALMCETATGVHVAKSATIGAGEMFKTFVDSVPRLNLSSHSNLPTISGNGFAESLIIVTAGNCTLHNIVLENGKGGRGGAVHVKTNATITLDRVVLRNNVSPSQGGGLFVAQQSSAVVKHSLFYANVALKTYVGMSSGGAIHSGGTLIVTDSTFHTNLVSNTVSQASGGALFNVGQATITDSVFLYNTAVGNMVGEGGALSTYRIGTVLDVVGCSFVNNSASHSGGAIFAQGFLKLLHCQFENHTAILGPTLRVTPEASQPELKNVSFYDDVCESEFAASDGYNEFLKPNNFRLGPW